MTIAVDATIHCAHECRQWNEEILKRQGFPLNLLPEVVELGSVVGSLQEELHGIKKGTPVAVAMGDFQV